jgi:uncharacterized membrane protein YuzA (DUF378 family)
MKPLNLVTLILAIIGGLNWGLVGLFETDVIASVFGGSSASISRVLYVIIGLSALYQLVPFTKAISTDEVYAERT